MKKAYLLEKLNLDLLDDAKPNELIILPRRFVINKLKERLVEKNGVLFDTDIFTFDDLITPAKNEVLKTRKIITREQEVLIVFQLLKSIFKGKTSFENVLTYEFTSQVIYLLNLMFLESKDYSQETFKVCENYSFLKELFERYKAYLDQNNLVNFSYLQDLAIKLFEEEGLELKEYSVAKIAFFTDFRCDQKRILKLIAKKIIDIEIFIPFFDDIEICIETAKFLESLGFDTVFSTKKEYSSNKLDSRSCQIKVYSYPNIILEINYLVKEIKKDISERKVDFDKIAVVVPSMERYKDALVQAFSEEMLPVNLSCQKSLIEFGFIKFILELLEFLGGEFDKQNFERIISHRFLNKENADFEILFTKIKEINLLELEQIEFVLEELEFFANLYAFEDVIENLTKIRRIFNRLKRIKNEYDKVPKPFVSWLEKIKKVFEKLGITKEAEFVNDIEFVKAFYQLNEIFEKGQEELKVFDSDFTFEEFLDIFKTILFQKMVDISINILSGIDVLSIQDALGADYQKVYLIGISDDILPHSNSEGFLRNMRLKEELMLDEIKDFDYIFQKDLIHFRTVLNSYDVYMSYPRYYQTETNKSPFLELEGIEEVPVLKSYIPSENKLTYREYKFIKNVNVKDTEKTCKTPQVPEIFHIKDRELIELESCPLKFAFKKFDIDEIEKEEKHFLSNLQLLFSCIQKMLLLKEPEEVYNFLISNIRYTHNQPVKKLAAFDIMQISLEIVKRMNEYDIKEFIPQNMKERVLVIKKMFEGIELQLFPNFVVKVDDEEILGFVKARRESKYEGIDKIWLATYIFELDKIAVIYLFEDPRFVIYENTRDPLDKLNEQILDSVKGKIQKLSNIETYQKMQSFKNCVSCEYSHVCILF
ncbi:3'-5' exonuclease [Anaerocellum danielii]|uniref:3'-5' exonuclease n=1 Tax=Anaerocellum danielii TaxID=1387557 RepID=A0ABZ0U0X0_9FIRM|nr:3'-5' exonuclease [Caldicellulosiruptor danielii]WPX09127.1 3'-5' exonuclease [Caldicellulosiruptor danielii]